MCRWKLCKIYSWPHEQTCSSCMWPPPLARFSLSILRLFYVLLFRAPHCFRESQSLRSFKFRSGLFREMITHKRGSFLVRRHMAVYTAITKPIICRIGQRLTHLDSFRSYLHHTIRAWYLALNDEHENTFQFFQVKRAKMHRSPNKIISLFKSAPCNRP